jgi:hypothetical protein
MSIRRFVNFDNELGEVAERSIAAGCKPAALVATEVRTLPSPPTFSTWRAWKGRRASLEKVGGKGTPPVFVLAAGGASRRAAGE